MPLESIQPRRFLALMRDFIVFEDDGSGVLVKKFDVKIGRIPPRRESHHFVPHGSGMTWVSIKTMGNVKTFASASEEALTLEAVERFR